MFTDAERAADELRRKSAPRVVIRVSCRMCDRLFVVPNTLWLTVPRPCCDDCFDVEPPVTRTDSDGWEIAL